MRLPQFHPDRWTAAVKLYATGKTYLRADGDPEYADAARKAFRAAARIGVHVDAERFYEVMQSQGAGRIVAELYLRTCEIDEGIYFLREGDTP